MAVTIKNKDGKGDGSVSVTGTVSGYCAGPPAHGAAFTRGIYIKQVENGANGTYRHLYDEPTLGTASPTSYTYL